ncbi:MAG: tetratricopeptide repeat protein, partial [Deltaproteobacteria bacterium]|nr:tetratricopeptide repeat protein [Deltaproteobacteria bacterium]
ETRANALHNHAIVLRRDNRLDEAERLHREALALRSTGPEPTAERLHSQAALVSVLASQRRFDEARTLALAVLHGRTELFGPLHPDVAGAHVNLGWLANEMGSPEAAVKHYRAAIEAWRLSHRTVHPDVAVARANLGAALVETEDFEGGIAQTRLALDIYREILGPEHPSYAKTLGNLAYAHMRSGQLEQAQREFEQALQIEHCDEEGAHPRCAVYSSNLATTEAGLDNDDAALEHWQRALEILEATPSKPGSKVKPLTVMGRFLISRGRADEAVPLLQRAVQLSEGVLPRLRAAAQLELARAHFANGDREAARAPALAAVRDWTEAGKRHEDQRKQAQALVERLG